MLSKWIEKKNEAIILRCQGYSVKEIEKNLGIARSTLSGWFKNIHLKPEQVEKLKASQYRSLQDNRKLAVAWHNQQKAERLLTAENKAKDFINTIDIKDKYFAKLALATLYLGEGQKKGGTSMGNSDPLILKFFIKCLKEIYDVPISKIKFELHLRADQDAILLKQFWGEALGIPLSHCTTVIFDKRTTGKPTYADYRGVCLVRCGSVAIQRELVYLSKGFIEKFLA